MQGMCISLVVAHRVQLSWRVELFLRLSLRKLVHTRSAGHGDKADLQNLCEDLALDRRGEQPADQLHNPLIDASNVGAHVSEDQTEPGSQVNTLNALSLSRAE